MHQIYGVQPLQFVLKLSEQTFYVCEPNYL